MWRTIKREGEKKKYASIPEKYGFALCCSSFSRLVATRAVLLARPHPATAELSGARDSTRSRLFGRTHARTPAAGLLSSPSHRDVVTHSRDKLCPPCGNSLALLPPSGSTSTPQPPGAPPPKCGCDLESRGSLPETPRLAKRRRLKEQREEEEKEEKEDKKEHWKAVVGKVLEAASSQVQSVWI